MEGLSLSLLLFDPSKPFVKNIGHIDKNKIMRYSQHLQQQRDVQMDFYCFGLYIFKIQLSSIKTLELTT